MAGPPISLTPSAARKTKQVVTEYLAATRGGSAAGALFRDFTPLLGKCLDDISAGNSGTVQVYAGDQDTEKGAETASGDTDRQYECYSRGHDFTTGDWCLILRLGGTGLEIIPFSGDGDSGFPPGTGGCDCGRCLKGVTIPGATQCCDSFLTWTMQNPWLTCATTSLAVSYLPNDQLISEEFTGGDGNPNTFRYLVTIDKDGRSYIELRLETDNGGDDVCLRYGREGFRCQCDNEFRRDEPYGTIFGIETQNVSCYVCLKPQTQPNGPSDCRACNIPETIYVVVSGFANGTFSNCTALDGSFALGFSEVFDDGRGCQWVYRMYGGRTTECDAGTEITYGYINISITPASPSDPSAPPGATHFVGSQLTQNPGALYIWGGYSIGCPSGTMGLSNLLNMSGAPLANGSPSGICYGFNGGTLEGPPQTCAPPDTITVHFMSSLGAATSTGACGDDCLSPVAPANPTGFCCADGNCLDFVDESFCNDVGGSWSASGDCDDSDCNPVGKCCLSDGSCLDDIDAFTCQDLLGGLATTGDCSTDCNGACCPHTSGVCFVTTAANCSDPRDTFYPNVNCSGITCLGSCCCYVGGSPNCCLEANVTENWCAGLSLTDCDGGLGTAHWVAGDTTCSTCSGSC